MRAMVLEAQRAPLRLGELPVPQPGEHQVLLKVLACGVCRTDLHILDGELDQPKLPLVLGHQIVGRVEAVGTAGQQAQPGQQLAVGQPGQAGLPPEVGQHVQTGQPAAVGRQVQVGQPGQQLATGPRLAPGQQLAAVQQLQVGQRVGVPWLGWTDGTCRYCRRGQENLCDRAAFTGYTLDGGYADSVVADARYCLALPEHYTDQAAAPLLCAGLIGYRTLRLAGPDAEHVGIYGFGSAAHLVAQVAVHQGRRVYAFTRPGDVQTQAFARHLGAVWAGGSDALPPQPLDAALIFAPVGALMVSALQALAKGGTVVSGGIHMSDIPSFAYRLLWEERVLRSVANLTRDDGLAFMRLAAELPLEVSVEAFALAEANTALERLRGGRLRGSAVLVPD